MLAVSTPYVRSFVAISLRSGLVALTSQPGEAKDSKGNEIGGKLHVYIIL
jgi:hypothetical protein